MDSVFQFCLFVVFQGLGDTYSDLDLVLLQVKTSLNQKKLHQFAHAEIKSERDLTTTSLSLIADVMRHFMANFSQINRILRARVPIVKATFTPAPIDLDLSIELSEEGAHHGFIMANYIAYACAVDKQVKQLFTFVKLWARAHGLVRPIAGNWFSNFQMISLVIYFAQTKGLLKPISSYNQNPPESQQESLKTVAAQQPFSVLLYEFFEFLISFPFDKQGKVKCVFKPELFQKLSPFQPFPYWKGITLPSQTFHHSTSRIP